MNLDQLTSGLDRIYFQYKVYCIYSVLGQHTCSWPDSRLDNRTWPYCRPDIRYPATMQFLVKPIYPIFDTRSIPNLFLGEGTERACNMCTKTFTDLVQVVQCFHFHSILQIVLCTDLSFCIFTIVLISIHCLHFHIIYNSLV